MTSKEIAKFKNRFRKLFYEHCGLCVERFNFGKEDDPEIMVDARKMVTAIKMLKEKLYQNA